MTSQSVSLIEEIKAYGSQVDNFYSANDRDRVVVPVDWVVALIRHNLGERGAEKGTVAQETGVARTDPIREAGWPFHTDTLIERLWRDAGLPEYFLGNGGTNHKLYEFAKLCKKHLSSDIYAPFQPTEEMCTAARGFILALDIGIRNWGDMRKHLERGGYPTIPYIIKMAEEGAGGHITKWDVADCIFQLMMTAAPERESVSLPKCAEAVKQVFALSLVGPDTGFKAEDVALAVLKAAGARFAQPATLLYGGPAGGGMSCTPIQKNSPTAQDDKHD